MFRSVVSQIPRISSTGFSTVCSTGSSHSHDLRHPHHRHYSATTSAIAPTIAPTAVPRLKRRLEVDLQELITMQCLEEVTLIDVRQPAEFTKQQQIPGSVHIPLGNLREAFHLSPEEWRQRFHTVKPCKQDKAIVFYARGPIASSAAVEIAHKLGYNKSRHYVGGLEDYCIKHNLPLSKPFTTSTTAAAAAAAQDAVTQHYNYHYYNPDLHYL